MARQAITGSQAPEGKSDRMGSKKFRLKGREIDPRLVDEISERVLALLAAELKIEHERDRQPRPPAGRNGV